ncbi:MAG TPA: DNA repair protein RecO, partial [Polyangiaceae bacterium]
LLRKTEYGESDLILNVLTDTLGRIGVIARGARASRRRFAGGVESFHGLRFTLEEPQHGDLYRLREARLEMPRMRLTSNLKALDVAGRALGWVRAVTPTNTPEPEAFALCTRLLDRLDETPPENARLSDYVLAEFGLVLLDVLGWALELERCVRCGRACPSTSASTIEPRLGGIVCQRCGGARIRLSAALRQRMHDAMIGNPTSLPDAESALVLTIVEASLQAHAGIDTTAP